MFRSCKTLGLACSSVKQVVFSRPLALSAYSKADVSQEDIDRLFAGAGEKPRAVRRGYSLNRIELIGGIAGDVRTRTGKNGKEYVNLIVATNSVAQVAGERIQREPEFHNVVIFGAAPSLLENMQKGKRVFVSGRIHYTPIILADGTRANRATIVSEHCHLIQSLGKQDQFAANEEPQARSSELDNIE